MVSLFGTPPPPSVRHCFKIRIQAFKVRIQAFKVRIQALKVRIQAFKIRIQAFKIRIQAFKIRIQAFKIRMADTSRNIGGEGAKFSTCMPSVSVTAKDPQAILAFSGIVKTLSTYSLNLILSQIDQSEEKQKCTRKV